MESCEVLDSANLLPFNSLLFIELLFLFYYKFYEELLKLFIAIVDAKLFETVTGKNFKAVDVENCLIFMRHMHYLKTYFL